MSERQMRWCLPRGVVPICLAIAGGCTPSEPPPTHLSRHLTLGEAYERPYLAPEDLHFRDVSGGETGQVLALRFSTPGPISLSIAGEPLFVSDLCEYFGSHGQEGIFRWFQRSTTWGTPLGRRLSLNGSTIGECSTFSALLNRILACSSAAKRIRTAVLSGLHTISAVEEPNGDLTLLDAMSSIVIEGVKDIHSLDRNQLRESLAGRITTDGYHLPSGISESYFLMGLRRFEELRALHAAGQIMTDHSRDLFSKRLDWVRQHTLSVTPFIGDNATSTPILQPDQMLTISTRPVVHAGLTSLRRRVVHTFRAPGGDITQESFEALPPAFSNGWLAAPIQGDVQVSLPLDVYSIETVGPCEKGRIYVDAAEVPSRVIGGGKRLSEISEPRPIRSIRVEGCTGRVRAFFLVPDRVVAALRVASPDAVVAAENGVRPQIAIDAQELPNHLSDRVALEPHLPVQQSHNLLAPESRDKVVIGPGWAEYEVGNRALWPHAPDYLDHPPPRFVALPRSGPSVLEVKTQLPPGTRRVRIGTLGVVSSMENDLRVLAAEDGGSFRQLYRLKPQPGPRYVESEIPASGELTIRVIADKRERLLLSDRNFVAVSHLLVWPLAD